MVLCFWANITFLGVRSDRFEVETEKLVESALEAVAKAFGNQVIENRIDHAVDGEQALAGQEEPLVQDLFFDQRVVDQQASVGQKKQGEQNENEKEKNDDLERKREKRN